MKNIIRNILSGITWGCTVFVFIGVFFNIMNGDSALLTSGEYIKMAIASMIVGVGFCLPSIVYSSTRFPMYLKIIIHMGIGLTVYFITAFKVGWISLKYGAKVVAWSVIIVLIISAVIWLCFMKYYQCQAKEINKKIKEQNK